jgi:hypothetical protein
LKVRQRELDQLAERHSVALTRLDRFERSVWGRLQRLCNRLVMVISGRRNSKSRSCESVPLVPADRCKQNRLSPQC